VQAQIVALLRDLQRDFGTAIIMITHDLGVVAGICDRVMVLYGGRIMEQGSAESIFYRPTHPYTLGLLGAVPRLDHEGEALLAIPGAPPNMARLPAGGWDNFAPRFMILPVALLTFINVATIARVMRGSLIEVLHSNFIRTARAKGLPTRVVVLRHALKPALLPVVSIIGPLAIGSITAALVTETVFSLPGLGKLIVNGAGNRDYTLVLGLVVLITVLAVTLNLLVDLAYAALDPKIRY
jgi:oligopeptide/dipeptide ABC transporter ATP-binding protein